MPYSSICLHCGHHTEPNYHFCPNCGKSVSGDELSTSIPKQLLIYAVSFLLAPTGLRWGIPYMRSHSPKAKIVGFISIALTVISLSMAIYTVKTVLGVYTKLLENPAMQMQGLPQLPKF